MALLSLHSMSKSKKDIKETGKNAYRFFLAKNWTQKQKSDILLVQQMADPSFADKILFLQKKEEAEIHGKIIKSKACMCRKHYSLP